MVSNLFKFKGNNSLHCSLFAIYFGCISEWELVTAPWLLCKLSSELFPWLSWTWWWRWSYSGCKPPSVMSQAVTVGRSGLQIWTMAKKRQDTGKLSKTTNQPLPPSAESRYAFLPVQRIHLLRDSSRQRQSSAEWSRALSLVICVSIHNWNQVTDGRNSNLSV